MATMRSLYFLVPGVSKKFASGGLFAEIKTYELAKQLQSAHLVTYREKLPDHPYLPELLPQIQEGIFVISWGFDVPRLIKQLRSQPVVYHAHSTGYGFNLPSRVPIWAVSRNSLGYWGQRAPNNPLFYLPNQISPEFQNHHQERDIDVLVQTRKTSSYVLQQLVPYLQRRCRVEVVNTFVPDLAPLFNRSKIYLYDSAEYWLNNAVSEGFGLPPLEAIACGCQLFTSVNGALADYLDPGFNCQKISTYCVEYDGDRLLAALENPPNFLDPEALLSEYRAENILPRFSTILQEVNRFFDYQSQYPANIQLQRKNPLLVRLKLALRQQIAQFRG
ncbi:MAG: glycosyltransferase family 1 protein [Synechococcus sp.]|nr:glycosyltransferase family 1 protein [Synechococcus sp.]